MTSINKKLTRIDENISNLKNILEIPQDTEIEAIEKKLQPEKGIIITECNDNGFPSKIKMYGWKNYIPSYFFGMNMNEDRVMSRITDIYFENCSFTSIFREAFSFCSELESLHNLPDSIITIDDKAFRSCNALKLDRLPSQLSGTLGVQAFYTCENITIKTLPDGVTRLSNGTFGFCTSITQLSMKNVSYIAGSNPSGASTFYVCTGLKSLWLGSALQINNLERYAFAQCQNLSKIFIDLPRATVEQTYYYNTKWDAPTTAQIICNDDEDFMTKEEFDAIDWSTYTE